MTDCPNGWKILAQHEVSGAISARAVSLLHQWRADASAVPGVTRVDEDGVLTDGTTQLLSYRYEMHPPDAQNPAEHTGTTVYYCPLAVPPPAAPPTGAPSSEPPSSPACP
jgi:hypothetical protein